MEKGGVLWERGRYDIVFEDGKVVGVVGWFIVSDGGERVDGSSSKDMS